MSKEKYVEVTLKLSKPVYDFYMAFAEFRGEPTIYDCLANILVEDIDGFVDGKAREFVIKHFGLENYSTIPVDGEDC